MTTKVLYHAGCIDGWTAAWAVWRRLGDHGVTYVPARYGDPPPDVTGESALIVDFSYPRAVLLEMIEKAHNRNVMVLDHHATAQADLDGVPQAVFDMDRSGAGLAWDHFQGRHGRPWLIDYVEDRDLWRFRLPDSKAINAWIHAQPRQDFRAWSQLSDEGPALAKERGEAVLRYMDSYVEQVSTLSRRCTFAGHANIPVVNAPFVAISELVGALADGVPFAVGWHQRADGMFVYSLRSRDDFDVAALAKTFGGGGHRASAGFVSTRMVHEAP